MSKKNDTLQVIVGVIIAIGAVIAVVIYLANVAGIMVPQLISPMDLLY